jgi:hypothetical protein
MTDIDATPDGPPDDGFEYGGTFYRWHVSDMGKDLMLIDRFSGLPITEFFDVVDDEHERTRGPILLTLIATSIRNGHPDWSVERIARLVLGLSLSDVAFVNGDLEEDDTTLPPSEPAPAPLPSPPPNVEPSSSAPNGSSSSPTPTATEAFEESYADRA